MLSSLLVLAAAVGGAAAASLARWALRRNARSAMRGRGRPASDGAAFELGDVIVLDGGRGAELWLHRVVELMEGGEGGEEGERVLTLFDASSSADASGDVVVVVDGGRPAEVGLVRRSPSSAETRAPEGGAGVRFPSTLEVVVEAGRARATLVLERRFAALADVRAVDGSGAREGESLAGRTAVSVAIYRGDERGVGVVIASAGKEARSFVGEWVELASVEVLHGSGVRG